MFRVLLRIWDWGEGSRRSKSGGRTGSARLHYERLESRQLLFAASVIEELPDWQAPLEIEPIDARPVVARYFDVSLEVRPGGGMLGGRSGERWSLAPLPTIPKDGWYDVPSLPSDGMPSGPPAAEYPDDSSLGGLIDIGGAGATEFFGPATQASPHTKGVPDREAQEVLALLAALQYVPRAEVTPGENTLDLLAADVAQLAHNSGEVSTLLTAAKSNGGMVVLSREALVAERTDVLEGQTESGEEEPLLPWDRTRVEEIQGRYQAFEVSTTEAMPASVATGQLPVERVSPDEVTARSGGAGANEPAFGGSSETVSPSDAVWPGDDTSPDPDGLPVTEEERKRGGVSLVTPELNQTTASRVLHGAAALAFLLYTSRTTRSADVKEPEKGRGAIPDDRGRQRR